MNDNGGNILVVDDDVDVLTAARILLIQHHNLVQVEPDPSNIPSILNEKKFDVILLDMNYQDEVSSGSEGFSWLAKILEINPSAVIILMTAYGDIEMAVKGIPATSHCQDSSSGTSFVVASAPSSPRAMA